MMKRNETKRVKTGASVSEVSPLNDLPSSHSQLYKRRWYILFIFSLLSINQSNIWLTYGAVLETAKEMYNETDGRINLLAAMGPVGFIPLCFFASWLIGEKGLRISCLLATFLCAAGAILRCYADANSFWIVIFAQVLNAAAGPVVMTAPPAISAAWFGAHERTLATAIGSLANYLGCGIGFLLGLTVSNIPHLKVLLFYEAIFSGLLFIAFILYFPSRPTVPPSATALAAVKRHQPVSLFQSMSEIFRESSLIFKSKDGMLMLMSSGLTSGVYGGWSSMLVFILAPFYSQWDIQWLGLANIAAGVVGGVLVGKLHDIYRHFKILMIFFYLASFGIFTAISLASDRVIIFSFSGIMALNIASGFCVSAIYPIAFEALIELTYPVKEEVSAGLISLVNNVACLILLVISNYKQGPFINWVMTGTCVISSLMLVVTAENYKRSKLDIQNTKNTRDSYA